MSETLINPRDLLGRLARELPPELHEQVFVAGSLAAACHHAAQLVGGGVRTKDADLVVRPSGNTMGAQAIARRLLALGWRHREEGGFTPGTTDTPADQLPAIRLYPPDHKDYFVELLMVPGDERPGAKPWVHVELDDGWYGLPGFEFLALTEIGRMPLAGGLFYAHPSMMALANLLSHRALSDHRMNSPIGGRPDVHRHAKDLGRVLALAHLESRPEMDTWVLRWLDGLKLVFPQRWPELARTVGVGLRALLIDSTFEEAHHCCIVGLLAGTGVSESNLRATADRLFVDVIEPVEAEGRAAGA